MPGSGTGFNFNSLAVTVLVSIAAQTCRKQPYSNWYSSNKFVPALILCNLVSALISIKYNQTMVAGKFTTVDEYFAAFPAETQLKLQAMRDAVKKAAPMATEVISYNMPAVKLHSVLVYYAAYEKHIGFYPTASGIEAFKKEFEKYKSSKGAVQFPIDKPIPVALVTKIVKFRIKDDEERNAAKLLAKKKGA